MSENLSYQRATDLTANNLQRVAKSIRSEQLSHMTLPELEAVVELVSKIVPAGNVPGMVLTGLAHLPGDRVSLQKMQQDIGALFSGVEQILDQAVYATFFMGPAYVLWGYQNLLKLAGKDISLSFPDGLWQFYVEYALREDTARHTNETHGFDTLLKQHDIRLSKTDRLTAWTMAAITCLHQFNELLANEWRERRAIALLYEVAEENSDLINRTSLFRAWDSQKPYRREADSAEYDYPSYRRIQFDNFLENAVNTLLTPTEQTNWNAKLNGLREKDLIDYQKQMSMLAYLEPSTYKETKIPFEITKAQIAIIHHNNYYLLPVCEKEEKKTANVLNIRSQIERILSITEHPPSQLTSLTRVHRSVQTDLRLKMNPTFIRELESLRYAPIIINGDRCTRSLPLSELRQTERGIGDHALTIFDTGETFVFDQSHIFFDGAWGAALAEIMTNEALSWAAYLKSLPAPSPASVQGYKSLSLSLKKKERELIDQSVHVAIEAAADTVEVDLKACQTLRRLFKQRNEMIGLTINDLLVLYRAIHAATYKPSSALRSEIKKLAKTNKTAATAIQDSIEFSQQTNPAILIPVDASRQNPRDRLYPTSIEVPLLELEILKLHNQTLHALVSYERSTIRHKIAYAKFAELQRQYLASLAGISLILSKTKSYALQGESASVGALKLLAHLPSTVQKLLDKIPEQFEVINNMIKGSEVLSNIGAVVPSSTLTRFITAKDDNGQKQLVWGVVTDAEGVMHINLRDFRPHVALLKSIDRKELAHFVAQDYLDAYARGLNGFVDDLTRITRAGHESDSSSKFQEKNHE
jgi:hypothetical protein